MCYIFSRVKKSNRTVGYKVVHPSGDGSVRGRYKNFEYRFGKRYTLRDNAVTKWADGSSSEGFYVFTSLRRANLNADFLCSTVVKCVVRPEDFIGQGGGQASYRSIIVKGRVK